VKRQDIIAEVEAQPKERLVSIRFPHDPNGVAQQLRRVTVGPEENILAGLVNK
jgi:hypothetical protein